MALNLLRPPSMHGNRCHRAFVLVGLALGCGGRQSGGTASSDTQAPDAGQQYDSAGLAAVNRTGVCTAAPLPEPREDFPPPADPGACRAHGDCVDGPRGICNPHGTVSFCSYSECTSDDDCAPDEACHCAEAPWDQNRCLPADCRSSADCGPDAACHLSVSGLCADPTSFHCMPLGACEESCRHDDDSGWQSFYGSDLCGSEPIPFIVIGSGFDAHEGLGVVLDRDGVREEGIVVGGAFRLEPTYWYGPDATLLYIERDGIEGCSEADLGWRGASRPGAYRTMEDGIGIVLTPEEFGMACP